MRHTGVGMAASTGAHALQVARERFFAQGREPGGLVPEVILRSWQRCAQLGLDAAARPRPEPLPAASLRAARERSGALQRLCRPELESMAGSASDTDCVVILTDDEGLVLDRCGSEDFGSRAARVALRPGVNWHEASAGTNAIGTALAERRAVEVRGAEHFFEPNRVLSCFAAPILDPQGRVVGALDLSGPSSVPHTHALGMVRLAVDQIEHRFFDNLPHGCEVLRLHSESEILGTAHEGVLVFHDRRLSGANRHGLGLLGLEWDDIGRAQFARLFASDAADIASLRHIALHDGRRLHLRAESRRAAPRSRPAPVRAGLGQAAGEPAALPLIDQPLEGLLCAATDMLDADLAVLLVGETGIGKEVFARRLHEMGAWREGPFVAINCAALPPTLIESELFGYEPGAFTGARREGAPGLLRQAHGGLLLLDEIGDMPLELQSRLLRVLQEREVAPLGSGRPMPVRFGLVCSTNRPLPELVRAGQFRADLYYRIAHHEVLLPPLRQRDDLGELIAALWQRLPGGPRAALPAPLLARLAQCPWPGNYRQLLSVLRVLQVHATRGARLDESLLPAEVRVAASAAGMPTTARHVERTLEQAELAAMREALAAERGNVAAAARRLGISRSTMYRRLDLAG
jgi:sigma-54 dependent transcriptional regulator, acetoin dehydrogenase operon transcriptional activator AcoR